MLWPIYIPSKGRARTMRVPAGVSAQVVVEPGELAEYQSAQPSQTYLVLPDNQQGLPYARQWIKEYATAAGHEWFWMLDDDVVNYMQVVAGRCVVCSPTAAFGQAQEYAVGLPSVGQVALEYRQFAWTARQPYVLNSYCDVCVAIATRPTRALRYRAELELKEDRDFTLQVLAQGLLTVRVTAFAFAAPANGSNAGGLQPSYAQQGREALAATRLAAAWPGICSVQRKPNGRIDARVRWQAFKTPRRVEAGT